MKLDPHLTHGALRTRIAKIRADAHDGDYARMHWELDRFVDALYEHLLLESPALDGLPQAARSLAKRGQTRIVSTLSALVQGAQSGAECESLAAALDDLLDRQDRVERQALRIHDFESGRNVAVPSRGLAAERTR